MSIAEELREYIYNWHNATGCRPSAMPITHEEGRLLFMECEAKFGPFVQAPSDSIPSFLGVDLYMTPDAALRRAAVIPKK